MIDKVKKYIELKSDVKITEIISEFLISYKEVFNILCELYKHKLIIQTGENDIKYIGKEKTTDEESYKESFVEEDDFLNEELEEVDDDVDVDKIVAELLLGKKEYTKEEILKEAESKITDNAILEKVAKKIEDLSVEYMDILIRGEECPDNDFDSQDVLEEECMKVIEEIVSIKIGQTRVEAIAVAKQRLEESIKNKQSTKEIQILERVYYEFRVANDEQYELLVKQIFG